MLAWDSYDGFTVVFWALPHRKGEVGEWRLSVAGSYVEDSSHTFTHWMPLPAAPVPDETKG